MTQLNILYGSLAGGGLIGLAFILGYILGLWFGARGVASSSQGRSVEAPLRTHNSGPQSGFSTDSYKNVPFDIDNKTPQPMNFGPPLPAPGTVINTPAGAVPPARKSGPFIMEADRRTPIERQEEEKMGELLTDMEPEYGPRT